MLYTNAHIVKEFEIPEPPFTQYTVVNVSSPNILINLMMASNLSQNMLPSYSSSQSNKRSCGIQKTKMFIYTADKNPKTHKRSSVRLNCQFIFYSTYTMQCLKSRLHRTLK